MPTFLLKTEPGEYSFQRLLADRRTTWSGVTSNAALGHLRTARKGDEALIYHTGDEKAIVGLAQFVSAPREDPERPGFNEAGAPRFAVIDLKPVKSARTPVTLAAIKADQRFADFLLVRQSRLSVMPVPPALDALLRRMAGF
jgi:predicted RNA-binding protein with PUA-like domain